MAKRTKNSHGVQFKKLEDAHLAALKSDVEMELLKRIREAEENLGRMRQLAGLEPSNGMTRRRGSRVKPVGAGGTRPGSLPGKILAMVAEASGPISVADIKTRLKLPKSKMNQVGVAFSSLKKRGEIKSAGRGIYQTA
jgi:hypothetical protein